MKVKETLQAEVEVLDKAYWKEEENFRAELTKAVTEELRPLLLDDDTIEIHATRSSIVFKRFQKDYSYKKDFVELRYRAERWDSWPAVGMEFSVYSTSDDLKCDWNKERLVMVGRLAEYFLDGQKKDYFLQMSNFIESKYAAPKAAIQKEINDLKNAINAISEAEKQAKKAELDKMLRSKDGIRFNLVQDLNSRSRSNYKSASLEVRFNEERDHLAGIKIIKVSASGLSANIEYKSYHQVPDGKDENGYTIYKWEVNPTTYTYFRVKMNNIEDCVRYANEKEIVAKGEPKFIYIPKKVADKE